MTYTFSPSRCQTCGCLAKSHDERRGCRVVFETDDGFEPCGCKKFVPLKDDSEKIKRLREEGFRV